MSRSKKHQPYKEIIDLEKELKEYKKLCRGNSRKFTYYTEWRQYILSLSQNLNTTDSICNLKHYLINCERVNDNWNSHYIEIMLVCITLLVDRYVVNFSFWTLLSAIIICLIILLLHNDSNNKEYCFYCDLIDIIEERETQLLSAETECDSLPVPFESTALQQAQE